MSHFSITAAPRTPDIVKIPINVNNMPSSQKWTSSMRVKACAK